MKTAIQIAASLTLVLSSATFAQQTNYADWVAAGQPALPENTSNSSNAPLGGLTVFTDFASFDAAAPGLPIEDFEGGLTGAGGINTCNEPVNSASNDVCFTPGDLIDGFNITSSLGGGVVALGVGIVPSQTSVVVGANSFAESTTISFDAADVDAVGFQLLSNNEPNPITVTAFDSSNSIIGTISAIPPTYIGFTSNIPIASVTIDEDAGQGELFDDLSFGVGGPTAPPSPVPALNNTAIAILLLLIASLTLGFRRRRQ